MSQAIKSKKIEKRTIKIKTGRNDKKTLNPFLKKKRLGTAKKIVGRVNISARKDKEACLEKTRKELAVIKKTADAASEFAESVINTVREPLIVLDQNLRVVKVNRSFYDFFKVKPKDTVGQLIYDLGNKQWDIPKLRELLETILPQKASFDNYEVEHDFTTIGRCVMLLNARQIRRAFGKERIILLAIEDITERKEIEAGLEKTRKGLVVIKKTADEASEFTKKAFLESEEKLKYFFDNSVIGKSFTLPGGEIKVNKAFCDMLGYSLEELQDRKWQELTHADDVETTQKAIDLIISGNNNSTRFEKRYIHKNGSIVWAGVSTTLRRDETGKPLYFMTVVIDISQRKQVDLKLNEQIVELQRWHNATLGRESRILDLKREVNELLIKAGHQPRYPSAVGRDKTG